MKKVYQELAGLIQARLNCIETDNTEWLEKYEDKIHIIEDNYLPSGSGINRGCTIDLEKSTSEKIIIISGYNSMDEYGGYDRWIDFTVTVLPSLAFDYIIKIKGNFSPKYQDLKDYLTDIFSDDLYRECEG